MKSSNLQLPNKLRRLQYFIYFKNRNLKLNIAIDDCHKWKKKLGDRLNYQINLLIF